MELNEIFKLIDAGYTKADIEALTAAQTPADTSAEPEPEPAPAQQDPVPDPAPAPAQNPADERYDRLEKLLTTLIGAQQSINVNADIGAADTSRRTPEQILGSVIAPPRKETKK